MHLEGVRTEHAGSVAATRGPNASVPRSATMMRRLDARERQGGGWRDHPAGYAMSPVAGLTASAPGVLTVLPITRSSCIAPEPAGSGRSLSLGSKRGNVRPTQGSGPSKGRFNTKKLPLAAVTRASTLLVSSRPRAPKRPREGQSQVKSERIRAHPMPKVDSLLIAHELCSGITGVW